MATHNTRCNFHKLVYTDIWAFCVHCWFSNCILTCNSVMEKYTYKKTQNDFNHIAEILFDIYLFQGIQPSRVITRSDIASCIQNFWKYPRYPDPPDLFQYMFLSITVLFLSFAGSKLKLCSANHRPGYFSNLACHWLCIVGAYSEQQTENQPWWDPVPIWTTTQGTFTTDI